MTLHLRGEELLLNKGAIFEQFLDNVISEHICHHLFGIDQDFLENFLFVVAVRTGDLLLEKSRALLVTSKVCHNAERILDPY